MTIDVQMQQKWEEVEATKLKRSKLFSDEMKNRDQIAALYFEVEILKLQYMFLKREQLAQLRLSAADPKFVQSVEQVNETCIDLALKELVENGYQARLEELKLL